MFNREYQKRATRRSLLAAVEFYRPAKLPDPRTRRRVRVAGPEQLALNFDGPQLVQMLAQGFAPSVPRSLAPRGKSCSDPPKRVHAISTVAFV
jgi:hypothetical protein